MRSVSSLAQVVNWRSIVISAVAVLSTWVCLRFGIRADFPLTLIATAIVFPLVFSINAAYTRREKALEEYGNLKAHGRSLYLASRDWVPTKDPKRDAELKQDLWQLFASARDLFTGSLKQSTDREREVYAAFGRLSQFVNTMRANELSSTECSRLNQYISKMIEAFENIRHIFEYRTPRTLRAFSDFFIMLLPILYGPYFAYQAEEFSRSLFYVMPILFSLILVGLANIQDNLENPFDQIGQDDVAIDPDRFIASLDLDATAAPAAR